MAPAGACHHASMANYGQGQRRCTHPPPEPEPEPETAVLDRRARVGWMLRVNRLYCAEGVWARLPVFARAFKGGSHPRTAAVSTISRWETAELPVTRTAVRRYEELLGLPDDLLGATAQTMLRYSAASSLSSPPLQAPARDGPVPYARIEELLDRVDAADVMSGRNWCDLTQALCRVGDSVLMPARTWQALSARLIAEMVIADGVPWMLRFEALNRLLNHPRGASQAVAACAAFAADGRNQAVVEVVCALDNTNHKDAAAHIVAQLSDPTSERARYGAFLASIRKARYGHFAPAQIRTVSLAVRDMLREPGPYTDGRMIALEIVRDLPAELIRTDHRDLAGELSRGARGCAAARPAEQPGSGPARRLASEVIAQLAGDVPGYRELALPELVQEMVSNPVADVRLYAACLLNATPYGPLLAARIARELARPGTLRDERIAVPLLDALRFLGGQGQRCALERIVIASGLPGPVVASAAHHLGHVGSASTEAYWRRALAHHLQRWEREREASATRILRDLVYALGMVRHGAVLQELRRDSRMPQPARAAADWWLSVPEHIHASARL